MNCLNEIHKAREMHEAPLQGILYIIIFQKPIYQVELSETLEKNSTSLVSTGKIRKSKDVRLIFQKTN